MEYFKAVKIYSDYIKVRQLETKHNHENQKCQECWVIETILDWMIKILIQLKTRVRERHDKHHCKDPKLSFLPLFAQFLSHFGFDLPAGLVGGFKVLPKKCEVVLIRGGQTTDKIRPDSVE